MKQKIALITLLATGILFPIHAQTDIDRYELTPDYMQQVFADIISSECQVVHYSDGGGSYDGHSRNYKFFGWLTKDGTATTGLQAPTTNFKTTYTNTEDKPYTLEVAGTLDKDYNQFDFLYSNVVNRTLPEGGKGAVH